MDSPPPDADRENFLLHIEHVRVKFAELDQLTDRIMDLSDKLITCTTTVDFRRIYDSFSSEIQIASTVIKLVKSQIDALEVSNLDFQAKYGDSSRESELNFRKISWAGFTNRLRSCLVKFNKAQSAFDKVYKERTGANGLNPDLSESSVMDSVNDSATEMQRVFQAARQEDDRIRMEDMKRLERSLQEIREAFLQIAALVDSQGEMLDCVEFSIINTKNYAYKANVQLIQARKKQRQKGWIKLACAACLVILLALLIFGIVKLVKG